MKPKILLLFFTTFILIQSNVECARGGGRGSIGRGGGRGWGGSKGGGGGGFWGKIFGGGSNTRTKPVSTGATASGNYPKQQWTSINGAPPPYSAKGFGNPGLANRPPSNPQLYRPKQPPAYNNYQHNSFANKPPPPSYSKYPASSISQNAPRYPNYAYPSSSAYGNHRNYYQTGYNNFGAGSMMGGSMYRPFGGGHLMTAALFYGLGRSHHMGGYSHYHHYHRYRGSSTETPISSNGEPLSVTEPPLVVTPTEPVPTFNLNKHKLFELQAVPWSEVSKEPVDLHPMPLNESILNLPFYGYGYDDWNETEIISRPPEPASAIVQTIADALFALGTFYKQKTTTEAPFIYYEPVNPDEVRDEVDASFAEAEPVMMGTTTAIAPKQIVHESVNTVLNRYKNRFDESLQVTNKLIPLQVRKLSGENLTESEEEEYIKLRDKQLELLDYKNNQNKFRNF